MLRSAPQDTWATTPTLRPQLRPPPALGSSGLCRGGRAGALAAAAPTRAAARGHRARRPLSAGGSGRGLRRSPLPGYQAAQTQAEGPWAAQTLAAIAPRSSNGCDAAAAGSAPATAVTAAGATAAAPMRPTTASELRARQSPRRPPRGHECLLRFLVPTGLADGLARERRRYAARRRRFAPNNWVPRSPPRNARSGTRRFI